MRFFWRDDWYERLDWYQEQFDPRARVRGEATPSYAHYPYLRDVPRRIHSLVPDARFIYIVRDPIERIVAHWVQARADGERMSLASALADYERPDHRLVCASRYATQIEQYLEYFSLPQLLVLDREDLKSDRGRTMRQVFQFLEVDPNFHSSVFDSELNTRRDKRAMTGAGSVLWQRALVPAGRRLPAAIKVRGRAPLHRAFSRPVAVPPLDPEVESGLRELLRPEADRLRRLTGKAFATWSI